MNPSKQRCAGSKGAAGMDNQRVEEPNLSGAYIRSLVKQLTSSRAHANATAGAAPDSKVVDSQGGAKGATRNVITLSPEEELRRGPIKSARETAGEDIFSNKANIIEVVQQQPPQLKKQARRRPHTRRPSQECLLNIAEARREIVTALHLHRAGNPGNTATKMPAAASTSICPPPKSGKASSSVKPGGKSSENYTQNINNNNRASIIYRCNGCCNTRGNEAKAGTTCGHLLCWICLGEWLRLSSPRKECPACAKPLTGNDVIPIAFGVPRQVHSHEEAARTSSVGTSVALQSATLLINPLPVPQPAWSTTGPSVAPLMQPMGAVMSPICQGMDIITQPPHNFVKFDPCTINPSTLFSPSALLGTANAMNSTSPPLKDILEPDCWHMAMGDEELARISSLGGQQDIERTDTINLATWFQFLKSGTPTSHLLHNSPDPNGHGYQKEHHNNNSQLQQLPEHPLVEKYEYHDDFPQLFEGILTTDQRLQEQTVTADSLFDVLPELPAECLWPDEDFDYQDWLQDLKKRDYNDILEFDGNQPLAEQSTNSEILSQPYKFGSCEDSSDADTAGQSALSSEIQYNLRVSSVQVGDKRKRDSYDRPR